MKPSPLMHGAFAHLKKSGPGCSLVNLLVNPALALRLSKLAVEDENIKTQNIGRQKENY